MIVRRRVMARSQKFHGGTLDAESHSLHQGEQQFHGGTLQKYFAEKYNPRHHAKSSTVELCAPKQSSTA